MPSKLLTSSFDSRRKGEESGMSHRGHLWMIGLISLPLKCGLDWFLSYISSCMRTTRIFVKDTLLILVVLKSQGRGDNCYIGCSAFGLTRASGFKDADFPFLSPK